MKHSSFGPRKTPMKRTAFKKGAVVLSFKRKMKRPTVAEGSKYLEACRGEPCFLNVLCAVSDWADPTVVPCHDNRLSAGKGMGLKASHERTLPGCMICHRWLDQGPASREEKFEAFDQGFARWFVVRARKMGLDIKEAA